MEGLSGSARGLPSPRDEAPLNVEALALRLNLIGAYGLLDVLDGLHTEVRELQRKDLPYLIIGHTGDAEPTSSRERLQSSSDVHPITEQIAGADHHVTDMHPYAEVDVAVLGKRRVGFGQGTLSLDGASDSIYSTAKLGQNAVTRRVGDATSMARYQPVQDFPACGECIKGSDLISPHEAAIALNVSREDSSQPALRFNGLGQG